MLTVSGLCKAYGGRPVLQDLELSIPAGELYGLLGPNGAGKTTFLNILCRLVNADRGSILIDGLPHTRLPKGRIGIAPQENLLYGSLSCAEHLSFFGSLAETLSGGMQRRLTLAIALVHGPELLILDEPTTGLDIESRHDLWNLIGNLRRQGMTILLTTHLLDEAERLCERIGILQRGRLVAEGTLVELKRLIPAREVVVVRTPREAAAVSRATGFGWNTVRHGGDLTFWLPESLELTEIVRRLEGIPLEGISCQPVRLEHIYMALTRAGSGGER